MKNKEIQMLSDHDILLDVIDLNYAKDHLQEGPFYDRFLDIYGKYCNNNERFPTSGFQYKDRVLTITCSFAFAGIDLSAICGKNAEAITIFNEGWRSISDNTARVFKHYIEAIKDIRQYSNIDEASFKVFSWHLLHYALKWILHAEKIICSSECLPYVFDLAEKLFLEEYLGNTINDLIIKDESGITKLNEKGSGEKYAHVFQECVNDHIESDENLTKYYCLKQLIRLYVRAIGVSKDWVPEYDYKFRIIGEIVIEEWKLVVMELKRRTLKELKLEKPALDPTILLFNEDFITTLSEQFFRDTGILSANGSELSELQRIEIMKRIIGFAQQIHYIAVTEYSPQENYSGTLCSSGSFKHYISKIPEIHTSYDGCFDGGGGNFSYEDTGDYKYRYISFSLVKDRTWDETRNECVQSKTEAYDRNWKYYGDNEDDSINIMVSSNLYMLDPFGMKGVFVFSEGLDENIEES